MSPAYIAVVIAVFAACAPLLSSITARQREKALDRYAQKMNLALPPEVRPRVIHRLTRYERASLAGGIGGAVIGLGAGLSMPQPATSGTWVPLTVFVGLGMGVMLATVTAATMSTLRPGPERRVARTSVPTLADYVPVLERWFAPLAVGCAVLALLGGIIALGIGALHSDRLSAPGLLHSVGAILCYLAIAGYVLGRFLSRRTLNAGQSAASEQELAWDDALRAATLRGLVQLPSALAACSVLVTFVEVGSQTARQPDHLVFIGGTALILFVIVVATLVVVDATSRPSQFYWRQLWRRAPAPGASR